MPQALTPAEVVDIIETTIEGRVMAWTAGPQVFLAGIYNSGSTQLDGVISPTITGDVIDWNPTGLSSATVVRVTASGGAWSIQSIVGDSGTVLVIINVGTNAVTIANNGAGTSQYRIIHTMDSPVLSQNESMTLWYDGTSNFWRVIATGGSVSPSGRFFRVRMGPFATRGQAEAALAKAKAAGYSDARIQRAD